MKSFQGSGYNADYAADQVGRFVVDFTKVYSERNGRDKDRPWNVYAARLNDALQTMPGNSGQYAMYVKGVAERCGDPLLVKIMQDSNPDGTAAPDLRKWLESQQLQNKTLFEPTAKVEPSPDTKPHP